VHDRTGDGGSTTGTLSQHSGFHPLKVGQWIISNNYYKQRVTAFWTIADLCDFAKFTVTLLPRWTAIINTRQSSNTHCTLHTAHTHTHTHARTHTHTHTDTHTAHTYDGGYNLARWPPRKRKTIRTYDYHMARCQPRNNNNNNNNDHYTVAAVNGFNWVSETSTREALDGQTSMFCRCISTLHTITCGGGSSQSNITVLQHVTCPPCQFSNSRSPTRPPWYPSRPRGCQATWWRQPSPTTSSLWLPWRHARWGRRWWNWRVRRRSSRAYRRRRVNIE